MCQLDAPPFQKAFLGKNTNVCDFVYLCCLTVRIIALVSGFYSNEHRIGLVPVTGIQSYADAHTQHNKKVDLILFRHFYVIKPP